MKVSEISSFHSLKNSLRFGCSGWGGIFVQTFKLVPYDKQGQNWGTSSRMTIKLRPIFGLGDRSNIFFEPPNR